jgi:hypothetical protein
MGETLQLWRFLHHYLVNLLVACCNRKQQCVKKGPGRAAEQQMSEARIFEANHMSIPPA